MRRGSSPGMLFTPTLLARWLQQLLSCVNHPSWDGSWVLTCFISDYTAAFYSNSPMSSLSSMIPAPSWSLYAAMKSSSRLLYGSFAIEHPSITFSLVMQSTSKGDFRSSPCVLLGLAADCIRAIPRNLNPYIYSTSFSRYVEVYHARLACSHTSPGCD